MILPQLFHWSPRDRRDAIRADGLRPYSPPAVTSEDASAEWAHGFGCICLAPTASGAWGLSGDMQHVSEIEEWDLWQVTLADTDEIRVRAEFGPTVREVRVFNPVPADRLWWVATRGD